MPHFFISYSKKDTRELALALNDALNNLPDVTCWVDKSMRAGQSWELQIESEIDKCDCMVVLYSEDIHRHKRGEEESYVLTEIAYAKRYAHKQIIPVMAQATQPPMSMIQEHYIDYVGQGLNIDRLVEAICFEAGITVGARHDAPSNPTPVPRVVPEPPLPKPTRSRIYDILPPPFEWIDIPAGQVTLVTEKGWATNYIPEGESRIYNVPAFAIAKYPMTNAQFAGFIKAGGYKNRKWWTDEGWQQREKDGSTEPRYWTDKQWNGAEYPVVGVSWYEAIAFCQWLSEASGENIVLPTEQQWQRAAKGDDNRSYPWGNDWDCQRCNNSVKPCDSTQTTPVTQLQGKGDSPFGVVDMAGNVWEWCLTEYESGINSLSGNNIRVMRGGSWVNSYSEFFRLTYRNQVDPLDWYGSRGFRLSCS
jgi:formylglycine-generating enzyme required for sulfatase activity